MIVARVSQDISRQVRIFSSGEEAMMSVFVKHGRQMLVVALIAFTCGVMLVAQSTTDGAIGGTVFDASGAVISQAQVLIHNNGTNAEQTINSDDSGYFRVIHLQPGSYTVTVSHQGFASFKAQQVIVQVGSLTELSPHMNVAGSTETVEVTAEAPQINYTSQDFAQTLNQTAISNLPINGGRWSNFALLTPGVVSDSNGFGLLSFRGVSTLLNNNTVDGADNNQAFFSEERGRTRAGYSTPKVAIDEFQVNSSNFSAEYGRAAGGVINTVTKSGTNAIHGETYFYDRDNVWGAANAFTRINVQTAPGVFTPTNFKPTDWRKMAGFGVGGPLIKDRVFFFVAYDWYRRNFPGTAVASTPGGPNGFFTIPAAGSTTLNTFKSRLGILTDAAAQQKWADGVAALNTMLGPVLRSGDQNILLPKLDWQITSKHHASFTLNRFRWSSPAGIQSAATVTRGIASFGNDYVKDTWGIAKLVSSLSSTLTNELRFQYGRDLEFEFSQPPTPYELNNLVNTASFTNPKGLPPSVSITNAFTFGVPNFLQRTLFPDERRMQVADTVNWNHGKHNWKFGVDFSHVNDNSQNLFNGFGSYSYSNLLDYFSDLNATNSCAGKPCYSSYTQGFGLPGLEFTTGDIAFFAQDDWKILPRLSLSLGVRYDYQMLPSPVSSLVNPAVPQTGHMPDDKNNIGPRVGFAWDVVGDGKTVLRGGYGIFYGRIINSTIFNALISTAMPGSQVSLFFTPATAGAPSFPQILTTGDGKRNVTFFDSNFQNPQIHQFDMTLEHNVGWGTVLSVSYLGSLGRELPGFADINICTGAGVPAPSCAAPGTITYTVSGGGPITTPTLTEPFFTQRANLAFGSMTDIFSGINSTYSALVFQATHRMSHHLQFGANFTLSRARDFGQNQSTFSDTNDLLFPGQIAPEKGISLNDIPHRFVAHAVVTSPWKKSGWAGWFANDWEFAPIYQWQNGVPYNLVTSGTPAIGPLFGLGSSINGSGGDTRLDIIPRNIYRRPNVWVADMRLAKTFTFQERYKLELSGDFFNTANKQDVTGVNNTGYRISGTSLTFQSSFGTPNATNGSSFTYTPRQIQLGVRVKF
jgi:hypothetical protein